MVTIIGLFPLTGNGGIASWTKKFLSTFPDEKYKIIPVNVSPNKDFTKFNGLDRYWYGIKAYFRIKKDLKRAIKENPDCKLIHITTSGGFGVLRDNMVAKMAKRHNVKSIMHCRFGTIKELYEGSGYLSGTFRKNIELFDNTWVLDRRSATFLSSISKIKDRIKLTPNSIEVPDSITITPKDYKSIGFVGNIVPTKGLFELVEAVASLPSDTQLYIAGIGSNDDIERIKCIAGEKFDNTIHFLGRLANPDAVKLMEKLDIISLPTYYPGEAFPISILEAMSSGKMVISCPRAAIPDMLTANDGSPCGLLVPEKDSKALAEAIIWCQNNNLQADEMCMKAYEKVKKCYSKEVVYEIYRTNYNELSNSVE